MTLKEYIFNEREITITQAAKELGYTRPHITAVCNGLPGGRRLAEIIEEWSSRKVKAIDVIFPQKAA